MDFCFDLIGMIEGGRTLEINDEYGNRYEFVGHLTIPNWTGRLSRVCIDYTIPEMELDCLKKSNEFFQKRIDYWEQLNLEEDDLRIPRLLTILQKKQRCMMNDPSRLRLK